MSDENEKTVKIYLSVDEGSALKQIAAGDPPHNQRAIALLALDDGADLAGAGITAGLTVNQVRYWLGRFRSGRLDIFPAELFAAMAEGAAEELEPPLLAGPEAAPMIAAPEIAGELTEAVPGTVEVVAVAAGDSVIVLSKKKKKDKKKKDKKDKKKDKKSKKEKSKKSKSKKSKKKDKKDKKDKKKK
jgi:hypothetical protein